MQTKMRHLILMRNVVATYCVMCETVAHIHFADDREVNQASKELALQLLLPLSDMRAVLKYLFYENLLSYGVWQADEGDAAHREVIETSITGPVPLAQQPQPYRSVAEGKQIAVAMVCKLRHEELASQRRWWSF